MGLNDIPARDVPDTVLPQRYSHGTNPLHMPNSSQILERLYQDQGVRVRMLRRGRPNKIPTVKELIDQLSKKHDHILELEAKGKRVVKPDRGGLTSRREAARLDTMRCMSETLTSSYEDLLARDEMRCASERPAKFEIWEPESRGSFEVKGQQKQQTKPDSSSTPTVPYSTADILYGNDVNNRGQSNEDVRQSSFGELDRSREFSRQKSKEFEQSSNRRPSSKTGKQKTLSIDSVAPFDKDREDPLKSLSAALPPAKPSHHYRPNGIKGNLLKSDQLFSSKTNGAVSGKEQDDLVAMGTLWSPNNGGNPGQSPQLASSSSVLSPQQQQQQGVGRNSGISNSNTNSYPPKVALSSGSVNQSLSSSNNTLNTQRKYPGNSIRPIVVQNNVSGRKNSNTMKEQEDPKYSDPMIGAPASFQQRIIELGALEGDTVRWERTKRLKKKKQDRDS